MDLTGFADGLEVMWKGGKQIKDDSKTLNRRIGEPWYHFSGSWKGQSVDGGMKAYCKHAYVWNTHSASRVYYADLWF